jgi:parallel beta-helix repeat protein
LGGLSHYLHSIDTSNLVDGKPVYYLISQHDLTINPSTHPEVGYIALINSTNITVEGLTLTKNVQGLLIAYTNDTEIQNNTITNNKYGIYLLSSSNNTISGNNITANERDGIRLQDYSNDNNVFGNSITDSYLGLYDGIALDYSSNNSISENYITNYGDGIYVYGLPNNTISGNYIAYNTYGICLEESSNNTFYHNNFIENAFQVYDVLWDEPLDRSVNIWDNSLEGNYWSNYTGVDSNHDGIGDTAHVIDANNTDNYPLMGMFHSFNTTLGKRVSVISNSTIESFEYFESNSTIRMRVSNTTANQAFGFCRICISHTLMNVSSIEVVIDDGLTPVLYHSYTLYDNTTHRWIYFAYQHSIHEIIIPEFPSLLILPLFMLATLLAALVYRRKRIPAI